MKIVHYHACRDREYWLEKIRACDWSAGQYLYQLLKDGRFHEVLGEESELLLLTETDELLAFCTYARRDEIMDETLMPWAGFVYTFPWFRGRRRMGKLLEYVYRLARADGFPCVYISTDHAGLYEKYGCAYWKTMQNRQGEACRIYRLEIRDPDYGHILGRQVSGIIDRPLGSRHPKYPELVYPVNYGYVEHVMAGDGAEQDVYVLGTEKALETFSGRVIAVLHRLNDCEDKWIVSVIGREYTDEEILDAISFQEQYFMGELFR